MTHYLVDVPMPIPSVVVALNGLGGFKKEYMLEYSAFKESVYRVGIAL